MFVSKRLFDTNLYLSKRVREMIWRDVLDHYRKHPDFKGKAVVRVACEGPLIASIYWEDPGEEESE